MSRATGTIDLHITSPADKDGKAEWLVIRHVVIHLSMVRDFVPSYGDNGKNELLVVYSDGHVRPFSYSSEEDLRDAEDRLHEILNVYVLEVAEREG